MSNGVADPGNSNPSNTTTVGESSNSDLTSELLAEDLSGICECGTCTLGGFLQNLSCPRPSSIPALSLPFLDVTHLDIVQRQMVLGRLYLEYKAVVNHFSKLTHAIERHILEKRMSFVSFSKTITKLDSFMPSLPKDEKTAEIKNAKTVHKLFAMFPEDIAFLNYHIFEDIAKELKNNELVSKVEAYKKFLGIYCRRGIFQCPSFAPAAKKGQSNFITELHQSQDKISIHELTAIQEQLCGILGVVTNTVGLCSTSKMQNGNMQVIFRVPDYVKDILIPLNAEQETAMRQLGFVGWSFYNGMDISYDPAQLANQLLATDRLTNSLTDSVANHIAATGGQASNIQIQMPGGPRLDDISSDDDDDDGSPRKKLKPAPGKKTRGRVKIPMEYIKNKLRRYTTFSKRKSNIMKKAYELSTLTGTQVMLMVASETGHVYTFATPKLQPMITSDAGKALIQTCLHQPDAVAVASKNNPDKSRTRMSSTGYEETDLGGYLPNGKNKGPPLPLNISSHLSTSINHTMPSVYTPPPPSLPLSLANELLPAGMLQSLVTSSNHSSLLPPPLISPEGYSSGATDEDGALANAHSPES